MRKLAILISLWASLCVLYVPTCKAEDWDASTDLEKLNDGLLAYTMTDYSLAYRLLQPLAEKNTPLAQLFVGRLFVNGYGTAQNCELAVRWLVRAAQYGNAEAAYDLAVLSEQGRCLPRSTSQALAWYKIAAASGDTRAPNAIGEIYLSRADIEPEPQKAASWFVRGVRFFDASSYYHLGEMYATGQGVPKDLIEAYKWFDLAADLEIPDQIGEITKGAVARDGIREELMPARVLEGQKRASVFRSQLIGTKEERANSKTPSRTYFSKQ